LDHALFHYKSMEITIEKSGDSYLADPEIVGVPKNIENVYERGLKCYSCFVLPLFHFSECSIFWIILFVVSVATNGIIISKLKTSKEIPLIPETIEGEKFRYFRNIFNGPETTILLTKNNKLIGWGKNENNKMGLIGDDKNKTMIFPPRILTTFPSISDIKQISINFEHTLVLLHNSTVFGIGSNIHGELGRNDIQSADSFIEIKFPEFETNCIKDKTCSIEMIAAEKDVSFFVFNYGNERHVTLIPLCNGTSYLDLNVCSGNGWCVNDEKCECYDGYYGNNCQFAEDCSKLNDCTVNGVCNSDGTCSCYSFAGGENCSIPVP